MLQNQLDLYVQLRIHIQATPLKSLGITFWDRYKEDCWYTHKSQIHTSTYHLCVYTPNAQTHTKQKNTNNLCILLIYIHNSHTSMDTHVQIFPTPQCRDCPKHSTFSPEYNLPTDPKKCQQKTLYTYIYPHTNTQTDHCLLPTLKPMYKHPRSLQRNALRIYLTIPYLMNKLIIHAHDDGHTNYNTQ